MASNFGDYMYSLLFAPLRKVQKSINQWAIFFSVIGKLFDDTKQDVFRVRSESMIVSSSEPVLELHGLDRGMVRLKGETLDNYRIRLAMKYIIASEAGTNKAILYVAKSFGYPAHGFQCYAAEGDCLKTHLRKFEHQRKAEKT